MLKDNNSGEYLRDRRTGQQAEVDLEFWCVVTQLASGDVVYVDGCKGVSWEGLYSIRDIALNIGGSYSLKLESVVGRRQEQITLQAHEGLRFACNQNELGKNDRPAGRRLLS